VIISASSKKHDDASSGNSPSLSFTLLLVFLILFHRCDLVFAGRTGSGTGFSALGLFLGTHNPSAIGRRGQGCSCISFGSKRAPWPQKMAVDLRRRGGRSKRGTFIVGRHQPNSLMHGCPRGGDLGIRLAIIVGGKTCGPSPALTNTVVILAPC